MRCGAATATFASAAQGAGRQEGLTMGDAVAFGLLDTSHESTHATVPARARSLTVSRIRWGHFGDIIEGTSVDGILDAAIAAGHGYCFIQSYGHLIADNYGPDRAATQDFFAILRHWLTTADFLVAGSVIRAA